MSPNKFFRPESDNSESNDEPRSRLSNDFGPHHKGEVKNKKKNTEAADDSLTDSRRESAHDPWVRAPTLPITPAEIPKLIGRDQLDNSAPHALAQAEIEAMLQLAPSLQESAAPLEHFRQGLFELFEILLLAIDPATGDSLLHAIIKAGNVIGLDAIVACYPRGMARNNWQMRAVHVFMVHQNRKGDNAMHLAVRMGDVRMVRAVLRIFCFRETSHGGEINNEYEWCVRDGQVQEMSMARPLLFLETRNNSGRNAGEEARACGYTDIGDYLDDFYMRMYPRGMRDDAAYRRRMEEYVRQSYQFLGDEEVD
ncbi:hypothetical protein ACHAQA_004043 [Verticillium albo-atrum]